MTSSNGFTDEQKQYLAGWAFGSDVARAVHDLPVLSSSAAKGASVQLGPAGASVTEPPVSAFLHPDRLAIAAQDRAMAAGGKLVKEEQAKRDKPPLDLWDQMRREAEAGQFPKGTDVFLYKFHGLFHVAPAQNAFMCRLRMPGGALTSWQLRGIAEIADRRAGGYLDVTTRANLQLREIRPKDGVHVVQELTDLGILIRGSGGDNIRNVTASPLSGIDPHERIETLPLAREMHHAILQRREMYGLPRKFNIAFDGAGSVSALEDTNDVGFTAVEVLADSATADAPAGIYFLLSLGGITGHRDLARPTGVLLRPDECVEVALAIVRVFIAAGDRTNRDRARLKYVLDDWGFDRFLGEAEKELGRPLFRFPVEKLDLRRAEIRHSHIGFHPQKQAGKVYAGVALPVGRMNSEQARAIASIAERFGDGSIRLTVWQNLIVAGIDERDVDAVKEAIEACGLAWSASNVRGGLVACTGASGCKYAAAHTKENALALADWLEQRIELDVPVNIHLTGCKHSCAQHYIGDIGLIATKVEVEDDLVEGYHVFVGGGYGNDAGIAREAATGVPFETVPATVERLLSAYLRGRYGAAESFVAFARRLSDEELRSVAAGHDNLIPAA
ncbi:MAG TPA: NirA family protein [Pirellulaceae bacterium]|jgi:ferredoxin-nitrite reductase|nr:NirA family protein [Pirellulaceae bacterium]